MTHPWGIWPHHLKKNSWTLALQDSMEASGVRGGKVSWCVLRSGKTLTVLEKAAGFLPNLVASKLFPQSPKG